MADLTDKSHFNRDEDNRVRLLISPLSDDYRPSISDKTRTGYFSQDCASQTERSDVVNLKEVTNMAEILVQDLSVLKKSLYYARHVLEADYKTKLEEKGLDLYCRVNDRILDLEKMHEERVKTIRRSFKQQLSDAVVQMANENEKITQEKIDRKLRLAEKHKSEEMRKNEKGKAMQQQESLIIMMKMQMKEQQDRADRELEEAILKRCTPSPLESTGERDQLVTQITNLESKLDDMDAVLEDVKSENKELLREVDDLSERLEQEREVTSRLKHDVRKASAELVQERIDARRQLEKQKVDLEREFENRMRIMKEDFTNSTQKQMDDYKLKQMSKLRDRDLVNQRLLDEAVREKEKKVIPDSDKDALIRKLQQTEKKLTAEIDRLRKELERSNKIWEMKVTVLKQSIHALKDESFLRASLQKQAARLHHASVTYASDGPVIVPRDITPLNKRYRILPAHGVGEAKMGVVSDAQTKGYPHGDEQSSGYSHMRTNPSAFGTIEPNETSVETDNIAMATSVSQRKDSNTTTEINIKT